MNVSAIALGQVVQQLADFIEIPFTADIEVADGFERRRSCFQSLDDFLCEMLSEGGAHGCSSWSVGRNESRPQVANRSVCGKYMKRPSWANEPPTISSSNERRPSLIRGV